MGGPRPRRPAALRRDRHVRRRPPGPRRARPPHGRGGAARRGPRRRADVRPPPPRRARARARAAPPPPPPPPPRGRPRAPPPPLLTSLAERAELLCAAGAERVVVQPFTPAFAALSAEEYVRKELVGRARLARVYVGFNFTFGRGGRAGPRELAALGREAGLAVSVEPPVGEGGRVWSSTFARQAVAAGDLAAAARCLGRPYSVRGPVVRGEGRGRRLGFPTANVELPPGRAMPPPGVYAGQAGPPGAARLPAAVSWGRRPTFGGGTLRLEVHLVGFSGDLYGRELDVAFLARIRDERRFERVEELVREMARDVEAVRSLVGDVPEL
ncbi:MAG: bifunctional riboflavin kinase/FAD synthetase [Clostridia bacterium]|nr:bifunctional riboflavin kinase/FAD synthetase [Clostridia bacterium]